MDIQANNVKPRLQKQKSDRLDAQRLARKLSVADRDPLLEAWRPPAPNSGTVAASPATLLDRRVADPPPSTVAKMRLPPHRPFREGCPIPSCPL